MACWLQRCILVGTCNISNQILKSFVAQLAPRVSNEDVQGSNPPSLNYQFKMSNFSKILNGVAPYVTETY